MEKQIKDLGWFWDLYGSGGWSHMDVCDDDGHRVAFDTPADVVRYLGLGDDI